MLKIHFYYWVQRIQNILVYERSQGTDNVLRNIYVQVYKYEVYYHINYITINKFGAIDYTVT